MYALSRSGARTFVKNEASAIILLGPNMFKYPCLCFELCSGYLPQCVFTLTTLLVSARNLDKSNTFGAKGWSEYSKHNLYLFVPRGAKDRLLKLDEKQFLGIASYLNNDSCDCSLSIEPFALFAISRDMMDSSPISFDLTGR